MRQGYKYSHTELQILAQNWKKFSKDNGGAISTDKTKSVLNFEDSWIGVFDMSIPFEGSSILFKTDEFKPLKIQFDFHKKLNDEFIFYPEDYMDKIAKLLGKKDFEIGDERFDKKYFIKGNNKDLLSKVISCEFKEYLIKKDIVNFKLYSKKETSFLELNLVINELKYDEMQKVLDLFKEALHIVLTQSKDL